MVYPEKEKKKKKKDLQAFLAKPENDNIIELPKRVEEEEHISSHTDNNPCKICGDLSEKRKVWYLCHNSVSFAKTLCVVLILGRKENTKRQVSL